MKSAFALVIVVTGTMLFTACSGNKPSMTAEQAAATTKDVRAFAASVADDVTRRGPAAWRTQFADTPAFFMVSDGQLVFPDSAAATRGIQQLTTVLARIELHWGEPMVVDPLTPTLAMMAMPYHELRVDPAGNKIDEAGYFTGLAERGPTGWKIRDAHWSAAGPPSPVQ